MTQPETSPVSRNLFSDDVSLIYERQLVPLLFAPYAADLAARLVALPLRRVLEIAAGSGVATRAMASALPHDVSITATDLSPSMLARASSIGTPRPVTWRQADAMALPFADGEFDAVVCQFGAMFFPDKPHAFAEARRVLRDGGVFLFAVWDRIEENELAHVVESTLASVFPDDPPRFMSRIPHGYFDVATIERDLAAGGFSGAFVETVAARSRASSPREVAVAYCEGTPWRSEIEARSTRPLSDFTNIVAGAIERRFGRGPIDTKIQAHVVTVRR
ncbi:MAG TPA: class I SAM-dependent methyltransferase [Gemmatimonadaceae bacterium]|nr:class I SAM-dependent methyltransferase [Gemmatimonadaceae bacterium]